MRYIVTHGHIFKNAGTTFDSALKAAFGKGFCDHRDDVAMRRGGADYLAQFILDNPDIKAISSHHLCNPLPISNEFQCIPVYFIRNPLERIISVYEYERKQRTGTPGAVKASSSSLEEYICWRFLPSTPKIISNYQTSYIGAQRFLRTDEKVSFDMLERALKMISEPEVFIGIVDCFSESFNRISAGLKKYFPEVNFDYKSKNVQNGRSDDEKYKVALEQLQTVLPEVISENELDLCLYYSAKKALGYL
ncbi:hypothetical protein MAH1_35160 [Sessilibacter sp. MAH1]